MNQIKESQAPSHLKKRSRRNYDDMLADILINDRKVDQDIFKKARHIYHESLNCKDIKLTPKVPTTLNIELVNKCNYACKMCYTVNHEGVKNQLSKETLFSIIDQANEMGVFTVMFGMGSEATLHPNLLEVLKYASSKIPDVVLFTNGSRIRLNQIQKFVDTGITRICISLDAADQEVYKIIRGGDLEKVENVIDGFVANQTKFGRPLVRVSFCNQSSNDHQQNEFLEKWIDRVDSVEVQTVRDLEHLFFLNKLDKESDYETSQSDHYCFRPFSYLTIWSDGQISPCCSFHGIKLNLGSVYQDKLFDIWNSNFLNKLRKEFIESKLNPICKDCLSCTF